MAIGSRTRWDRTAGRRHTRPMSDINVTPMVDVMLVLLVIFMVTAPLLTVGVQVDLPKTRAAAVEGQDEPVAVSVDGQGRVFVQDSEVDIETLAPRLQAIAGNNPDLRVFVRGDRRIDYGRVMAVIAAIHAAGFQKVALITAPPGGDDAGARRRGKQAKSR